MRSAATLTVAALLLLVAVAAPIMRAAALGSWVDQFSPPFTSVPNGDLAIACISKDACFVPAVAADGFGVYKYDGKKEGTFTALNFAGKPLMVDAIAVAGTEANPKGVAGGFGLASDALFYFANATTLKSSSVPELFVQTQDIRIEPIEGKNVLSVDGVGNNVLFSTDSGASFTPKKISSSIPDNTTMARYTALQTDKEWYVTLGSWPQVTNELEEAKLLGLKHGEKIVRRLSKRVAMVRDATGRVSRRSLNVFGKHQKKNVGDNFYTAIIAKTSDGGDTWVDQVNLMTDFYFNGIDCSTKSLNTCVAVGEGYDQNAGGHIYRTTDGKTWKQVFQINSSSLEVYSIMSVRFSGNQEVWAAGSIESVAGGSAIFFHSTDGGATWAKVSGPSYIIDVTDISFVADGTGFASALTSDKDSTILKYDPNGPPPTPAPSGGPAPPPSANFIQMQCSDAQCSQGCANHTFPTDTCLKVNGGGSAKIQCGATALTETFYPTSTICAGTSQAHQEPLNQCLKDTTGTYIENFCTSSSSVDAPRLWHSMKAASRFHRSL